MNVASEASAKTERKFRLQMSDLNRFSMMLPPSYFVWSRCGASESHSRRRMPEWSVIKSLIERKVDIADVKLAHRPRSPKLDDTYV